MVPGSPASPAAGTQAEQLHGVAHGSGDRAQERAQRRGEPGQPQGTQRERVRALRRQPEEQRSDRAVEAPRRGSVAQRWREWTARHRPLLRARGFAGMLRTSVARKPAA